MSELKLSPKAIELLKKLWVSTVPPIDDPQEREEELLILSSERSIRAYDKHNREDFNLGDEPQNQPMSLLHWLENYGLENSWSEEKRGPR